MTAIDAQEVEIDCERTQLPLIRVFGSNSAAQVCRLHKNHTNSSPKVLKDNAIVS